jgi:translation elongation factor EF-4
MGGKSGDNIKGLPIHIMKAFGKVELPQEAFLSVLKIGRES